MGEKKKYKAVIFDVDGTLFDTKDGILKSIREVSTNLGYKQCGNADESTFIGPPVIETFIKHFGMDQKTAGRAASEYRELYVEKYISSSEAYEGMYSLISSLKRDGVYVAIATMKTRKQVQALLDNTVFMDVFDSVETALDQGRRTKADMISAIIDTYQLEKDKVWMIGDTYGDEIAANEAGIHFVGVTYGYGFSGDKAYPFLTARRPDEIIKLIQNKMENT